MLIQSFAIFLQIFIILKKDVKHCSYSRSLTAFLLPSASLPCCPAVTVILNVAVFLNIALYFKYMSSVWGFQFYANNVVHILLEFAFLNQHWVLRSIYVYRSRFLSLYLYKHIFILPYLLNDSLAGYILFI